jgi:hypothetical protein
MNKVDGAFLPNVQCPYCKKWSCIAITGFGSTLCIREKMCRFCKKEYIVEIYVEVNMYPVIFTDGNLNNTKRRISKLKEKRKKLIIELNKENLELEKSCDDIEALLETLEGEIKK